MTRPPPFRPAEDRLVADACARSRTERIRDLARELNRSEYATRRRARELSAPGGAEPALDPWNAIQRVALNLALEAERA